MIINYTFLNMVENFSNNFSEHTLFDNSIEYALR